MFRLGQSVRCVDVSPRIYSDRTLTAVLVLNATYTIRGIDPRTIPYVGVATVLLEEIWMPAEYTKEFGRQEPGFASDRFRPLVKLETDISVFKAMLAPVCCEVTES